MRWAPPFKEARSQNRDQRTAQAVRQPALASRLGHFRRSLIGSGENFFFFARRFSAVQGANFGILTLRVKIPAPLQPTPVSPFPMDAM
jgi:hypothetical protein